MNKMISVQMGVLEALEDIGMEEWNQAPIVLRWCTDAAKLISGKYDFKIIRSVKELKNKRELSLPPHTYEVLNVFSGIVGNDCNVGWTDKLYPQLSSFDPEWMYGNLDYGNSLSVLYGTNISNAATSLGNYSIVKNKLVFDCDLNNVQDMTLYLAVYQTDEQGFIMINENHLLAVSSYVKHMIAERSLFGASPMPDRTIARLHKRWTQQKKLAQRKSNKMPKHERDMMSTIANNPLSGKVIDYHGDYTQFIH